MSDQLDSRFLSKSDEDETEDVKKNGNDEKAPVGSRRRSQESKQEDTKVTGVVSAAGV